MTTTGTGNSVTSITSAAKAGRTTMRYTTATICGGLALFYLIYFFVANARERAAVPHTESMAPVYLIAVALFLIGAVLLFAVDQPALWAVGTVVPILAVGLYLWNGIHGVWDDPVAGAMVSAAEVVLVVMLVSLAVGRPPGSVQRGP